MVRRVICIGALAIACMVALEVGFTVFKNASLGIFRAMRQTIGPTAGSIDESLVAQVSAKSTLEGGNAFEGAVANTRDTGNAQSDKPSVAADTKVLPPSVLQNNSRPTTPWLGWAMRQPKVDFPPGWRPKFVLKHLTKAGGTFAIWLLYQVLPESHVRIVTDDAPLFFYMQRKNNSFTAVTMRNPCDLYVSFAHFHPGKAFGYRQPTFGKDPYANVTAKQLEFEEDLPLFHEWLRNSRCTDLTGFYSFYFWQSIARSSCFDWWNKDYRKERHPEARFCTNQTRMRNDLSTFSPSRIAHCWIFQETLVEDMRDCFQAYELSSDFAKGMVNWARFNYLASLDKKALEKEFRKGAGDAKMPSAQAHRHRPCKEYFPPEIEKFVRSSDPYLFEKFGYMGCCQPSTHVLE